MKRNWGRKRAKREHHDCNAAALEKSFGIKSIKSVDENFSSHFYEWIKNSSYKKLELKETTEEIIEKVMSVSLSSE